MRKTSIIFAGLIGILLLIAVFMPLGMGLWVQNKYPEILTQVADTPYVTLKIVKFKRGWFQSRATLNVIVNSTLGLSNNRSQPLSQFIVQQKIQHGPIIFLKTIKGSRQWVLARAALQNESQDMNLNFKANSLWTMANGLNTQIAIQHILLGNEQKRLEINNLNGKINFTHNDHHFRAHLSLANASIYASNPEKVENNLIDLVKVAEIEDLVARLNIHKINSIWYGDRHFAAKKTMIYPYQGTTFIANNWQTHIIQTQQNGASNLKLTNSVDEIIDKQIKIKQLQVTLDLNNMNSRVLEHLMRMTTTHSKLQRLKLYPLLIDLFSKGMTIDLSQLQFATEDGPVSLQAQIFSAKNEDTELGLMHLLENVYVQAKAYMPRIWLQKNLTHYYQGKQSANPNLKIDPDTVAQSYVEYWVSHRLLVPQEQQLTMDVNYKEGKLLINGEKPSLNSFIGGEPISSIHE